MFAYATLQAIHVWFTDNAAAEEKDLRGDHEELCYVIKDMYHSMAIVTTPWWVGYSLTINQHMNTNMTVQYAICEGTFQWF